MKQKREVERGGQDVASGAENPWLDPGEEQVALDHKLQYTVFPP